MLVDKLSSIMSQNHSNSDGTSTDSPSFAEPFGNRVLSLTEVDALRRMTAQNSQQQQNTGGYQPSQLPANPFLVLTQVPVQATPFASFANLQGNQNQTATGDNRRNDVSVQQSQNHSYLTGDDNWEQLLQPTPLAPNHSHSSKGNGTYSSLPSLQASSQQPQQSVQSPDQMKQDPSSLNNDSTENSTSNTDRSGPFNPSTMSFLQELMMNAATAALQQQQQMIEQQNNNTMNNSINSNNVNSSNMNQHGHISMNSNNITSNSSVNVSRQFMQGMNQGGAGRMQVDSSVGLVSRPELNNQNTGPGGVQAWKQMWDSASKTIFQQQHNPMQQAPSEHNKPNSTNNNPNFLVQPAKRKFQDLKQNNGNDRVCSSFHSPDEDEDEDFLDIAPTPLSEIRAREQSDSMTAHGHGIRQQAYMSFNAPEQPTASVPPSQWQKWKMETQQQQQEQVQTHQQAGRFPSQSKKGSGSSKQQTFILPSTMMPPTVLASTFTEEQAKSNNRKRRTTGKSARLESPNHVLGRIVQERGYGSKIRITSEEAGYDAVPSPLQLASFGTEVVKAVHTSNAKRLKALLSAGLSPNPCNQFRDSIVDLVCKRANEEIFQVLMDHGSELRVCDGFGRTPLHHCCWASEFSPEIADAILKRDLLQLFIEDKRGQTPLEYVRPNLADAWVEFLEEHKDEYFPVGGSIPRLRNVKELRPDGSLPDPSDSLSVSLAGAVSSGQVTPEEVCQMDDEARANYEQ